MRSAQNWAICEGQAAEHGQQVDRNRWRLVGPMHIAETREQARENVKFGLGAWLDYFRRVAALPLAPEGPIDDAVDAMNKTGFAVIGTVEDAIAQLERLQTQSGGFGCFLQMAHDWADREATRKSYELIARYVMPHFQGARAGMVASRDWAAENRAHLHRGDPASRHDADFASRGRAGREGAQGRLTGAFAQHVRGTASGEAHSDQSCPEPGRRGERPRRTYAGRRPQRSPASAAISLTERSGRGRCSASR